MGPFSNYKTARKTIKENLAKDVLEGEGVNDIWTRSAIQELIPWGEVVCDGNYWKWDKLKSRRWIVHKPIIKNQDVLLYIPFKNGRDLAKKAIQSARCPDVDIVVIDSTGEFEFEDVPIYRTPNSIHFTGQQNCAQQIAKQLGYDYLLFMHADAECLDHSVVKDLLVWSKNQFTTKPGIAFSGYDYLSVFPMQIVDDVGVWDETWKWYKSDIDYYYRVRLRGWSISIWPDAHRVFHSYSSSIRNDPILADEVKAEDGYTHGHYFHKWGGDENTEKFSIPYNQRGEG